MQQPHTITNIHFHMRAPDRNAHIAQRTNVRARSLRSVVARTHRLHGSRAGSGLTLPGIRSCSCRRACLIYIYIYIPYAYKSVQHRCRWQVAGVPLRSYRAEGGRTKHSAPHMLARSSSTKSLLGAALVSGIGTCMACTLSLPLSTSIIICRTRA